MRLVLLGTGSADLYPAPWCHCEHCSSARQHGGRDIRGFPSAFLMPDVLIDMPPDVAHQAIKAGVELFRLRFVLITHSHPDHLSGVALLLRRTNLWARQKPEGQLAVPELAPLTIYGNTTVLEHLQAFLHSSKENLRIELEKLKPFEQKHLDERTIIHPLLAAHRWGREEALIFVIERDEQSLLYATDTGWFPEPTWDYLRQFQLDGAVVEATYGLAEATEEHMNIAQARKVHQRLLSQGLLKQNSPFVLTHLSPHWTPPHHLLEPMLRQEGIIAGYDGLTIEIM